MNNIIYKFVGYGGSYFINEIGETVDFEIIKDNFYKLNGKKGKIYHKGYTRVVQHGYLGGYDNYGFVFQDDLKTEDLDKSKEILLEYTS